MSDGKNKDVCFDLLFYAVSSLYFDCCDLTFITYYIFKTCFESDFSAEFDNLLTNIPDYFWKNIGPKVRHVVVKDFFGSSEFRKYLKNFTDSAFFIPAICFMVFPFHSSCPTKIIIFTGIA